MITEEIDSKLRMHFSKISEQLDEIMPFIPIDVNEVAQAWRQVNLSIMVFAQAMMDNIGKTVQ